MYLFNQQCQKKIGAFLNNHSRKTEFRQVHSATTDSMSWSTHHLDLLLTSVPYSEWSLNFLQK